jgi:hypothetical protein
LLIVAVESPDASPIAVVEDVDDAEFDPPPGASLAPEPISEGPEDPDAKDGLVPEKDAGAGEVLGAPESNPSSPVSPGTGGLRKYADMSSS